jgi:NMD protein affecting ribosome stability and mRNA decay
MICPRCKQPTNVLMEAPVVGNLCPDCYNKAWDRVLKSIQERKNEKN